MSLYSLALFVHVIGVLGAFIAVALELKEMLDLRRATTVEQVRDLTGVNSFVEPMFVGGGLCIFLPGFYMTATVWGWRAAWIDVSLTLLITMSALGPLINMRRLKAIHMMAHTLAAGPIPLELKERIVDPVLWTSILTMTSIVIGIVFLMTVKPGLPVTVGVAAVALLVGLALGSFARRWTVYPMADG